MNNLIICNIFCPIQEDLNILSDYLKAFPVFITDKESVLENTDIPTLIIGWSYIKNKYPQHNILNKKISNNIYWNYSFSEEKDLFLNKTKELINDLIKDWLPKNFISYNYFFDGDLEEFIEVNINKNKKTFLYYKDGAIYLFNDEKNYIIDIKSLFCFDLINKEQLSKIINKENWILFSSHNMHNIIELEQINNTTLENIFWVKYSVEIDEQTHFNIIPQLEYHKFIPYFMNLFYPQEEITTEEQVFLKRMKIRDIATVWLSNRKIPVSPEPLIEGKQIKRQGKFSYVKINFSNKRTLTNRIVCKDPWNIQNEEKGSKKRSQIISRFEEGRILVCDYNSFESRISIFLTKNKEFIEKYKNKDIHVEVGKVIFIKELLSEEQRSNAKNVNHAMLYGAGHNKLIEMLKDKCEEPEETLYYVKKLLEPIIINSKKINEECHKNGHIITPWGSIITPNKDYAAYNNFVQTIASEIIVDKILELKEFLKDKKSQILFQIHDSIVFDIAPDEKKYVKEIIKIMSTFKNGAVFGVEYKVGKNYLELSEKKQLKLV